MKDTSPNSGSFQNSSLVDSHICQSCAKCCKQLVIWISDNDEIDKRIEFLDTSLVEIFHADFPDEFTRLALIIKIPCVHLDTNDDGTFSCRVWNHPDKPMICRNYPSNMLLDPDRFISRFGERALENYLSSCGEFCPAIKDLLVDMEKLNSIFKKKS